MVGDHHVNRPVFQAFPQFLAIFAAANRRSTFVQRRPICNRFSRQMQVVRTGFHADRKSFRACSAQSPEAPGWSRDARCANEIHIRGTTRASSGWQPVPPRLAASGDTLNNNSNRHSARASVARSMGREVPRAPAAAGQSGQHEAGRSQLLLRNHGEAIDARIDQKAFEPRHSGGRESFDIVLIIVDYAAPGPPIDAASALARLNAWPQRGDRRGRRKTVQRHVDQQRVASRRRGACRVSKPSHSARPGSLICTWESTSPGRMAASPKSWTV
jgi:hypothetical protein